MTDVCEGRGISYLKSRNFICSKVKSGILDFRVSSKKSATGFIILHLSRGYSVHIEGMGCYMKLNLT